MWTRTLLKKGIYEWFIWYSVALSDFLLARLGKGNATSKGFSADEHDAYLDDYTTRYAPFIWLIFFFWLTSMSV